MFSWDHFKAVKIKCLAVLSTVNASSEARFSDFVTCASCIFYPQFFLWDAKFLFQRVLGCNGIPDLSRGIVFWTHKFGVGPIDPRIHKPKFVNKSLGSNQGSLGLVSIKSNHAVWATRAACWEGCIWINLALKGPITTAADNKFCYIFFNFQKNKMIFHENRQFSWNIMPYLLFLESSKF